MFCSYTIIREEEVFKYPRLLDYKNAFLNTPSSVNVALLTGHSMLRVQAMNGDYDRAANENEINIVRYFR